MTPHGDILRIEKTSRQSPCALVDIHVDVYERESLILNGCGSAWKRPWIDIAHSSTSPTPIAHGLLLRRKHSSDGIGLSTFDAPREAGEKVSKKMDILLTLASFAHRLRGGSPADPDLSIVPWHANLPGGHAVQHQEFARPAQKEPVLSADLLDQRETLRPVQNRQYRYIEISVKPIDSAISRRGAKILDKRTFHIDLIISSYLWDDMKRLPLPKDSGVRRAEYFRA